MKVINCQTLGEICECMLDGEPVFVLRAQDQVALSTLEEYYHRAFDAHAKNLTRVRHAKERFREWQEKNPQKVKVPD